MQPIRFATDPSRYRHWRLDVRGEVATLALDVAEDGGLVSGYALKLNSYDLGVDIELADAIQRVRFSHPTVRALVITSLRERTFSAGANIVMLGQSSHPFKVNFCKFTNETRLYLEELSAESHVRTLCALNGTASGGGYELALACDEILLVDDGSSAVSLPEVALLGVLPGTGGLTRVVDKRRVRRDHADFFSTTAEGVRGARAVEWRLVDELVPRSRFMARVAERAAELAAESDRPKEARGIELPPLACREGADGREYPARGRSPRGASWTTPSCICARTSPRSAWSSCARRGMPRASSRSIARWRATAITGWCARSFSSSAGC